MSVTRAILAALLVITVVLPARAHHVRDIFAPTPPQRLEREEKTALTKDFGAGAMVVRGIYDNYKLWRSTRLRACFYDGEARIKSFFVRVTREWLAQTSLAIDFGGGSFRECGNPADDDIRISFIADSSANWSYVGTDSKGKYALEGRVSLNIVTEGKRFDQLDREEIRVTILHELGHALGFYHEHQSPESHCEEEFDWNYIRDYTKENWLPGKSEEEVEEFLTINFRQELSGPGLSMTAYDRRSIMHYALPARMFLNGEQSRCFISEPRGLSRTDRATIRRMYPLSAAAQDRFLQRVADTAAPKLRNLKLTQAQLGKIGGTIARNLADIGRPVRIRFALNPDRRIGDLRSSSQFDPCEGSSLRLSGLDKAQCGVAKDGSNLVIEIGTP